jgi:DNA polymerase III epsilon subunit-like protein
MEKEMNYIAIDFETANEKRNSPCSIGIVVVKNGHVVEKIHHMIRPKEMKFMPISIGIHGIRPAMVENEPEFDKVWEKIRHHFNGNLVIAHNASFDISDELKCKDINEISDLLGVTVGTVTGSGYRPSSVKGGVLRISGRISKELTSSHLL